jgi:hypothetical protein
MHIRHDNEHMSRLALHSESIVVFVDTFHVQHTYKGILH